MYKLDGVIEKIDTLSHSDKLRLFELIEKFKNKHIHRFHLH